LLAFRLAGKIMYS